MHMKKATNITLATLAAALLASSCIKEADPYEIATEDQVTLETLIEGIPASLVQAGSAGYASEGQAWDFALPAIHRRLCRYFTTDTPAEAYSGIGFSAVKKTGSGKDSCA